MCLWMTLFFYQQTLIKLNYRAAAQEGGFMIHHYITQYKDEQGRHIAESWLQLDLFGKSFCFSKRRIEVHEIGI